MPETPDLKALAERYLDLWEEQFAAAAADPALAAAMAAWLGPWRALAAGTKPGGTAFGTGPKSNERAAGARQNAGPGSPTKSGTAAGTAPTGAASRDGGRGLERILEQLERIERRLDALEQQRTGQRKRPGKDGGPGARARRGRSGGAD
jgi:hypothetical protein